jgi:hypothetical protein
VIVGVFTRGATLAFVILPPRLNGRIQNTSAKIKKLDNVFLNIFIKFKK